MAIFLIAGSLLPVLASARGAPAGAAGAPVVAVSEPLQTDLAVPRGMDSQDDEDDDAADGQPSRAEAASEELDKAFGAAAPTLGVELSPFEQVPLPLPSGPFGRILPPPFGGGSILTSRESTPALVLGRLGAPPLAVPRIDEPLQAVAGLIKSAVQPAATAPTPAAPTARTFPRSGGPSAITTTAIVANAERLLGIPYVWGGNSTSGLDCSAYVSMVWGLSRHTTDTLPSMSAPIAKDELVTGDAMNLPTWKDPQGYGHVRLFDRWANAEHTRVWVYEETSATGRSVHRAIAYDDRYQPIRRVNYAPDGASLAEAGAPKTEMVAAVPAIGSAVVATASAGGLFATKPVGRVGTRSESAGSWWEAVLGRGWWRSGAAVEDDGSSSADAGGSVAGVSTGPDGFEPSQPSRPARRQRPEGPRPTRDTAPASGDPGGATGRSAGAGEPGSRSGGPDATATPRPTRRPRPAATPATASASPTTEPRHNGWTGRRSHPADDGAGADPRPTSEATAQPSSTPTAGSEAARPRRRAAVEPTSSSGIADSADGSEATSGTTTGSRGEPTAETASGRRRGDALPESGASSGADATPGTTGYRRVGAPPDDRTDATPDVSSGRRRATPEQRTIDRADRTAEPSSGAPRPDPTVEPRTPRDGMDERPQRTPAAAQPTTRAAATQRPENTAAPERRAATPQPPRATPGPAPSRADSPKSAENSGSEGRRAVAPTTALPPKAAAPPSAEPKRTPPSQQAPARQSEQPRQAQPARSNSGGKGR